MHVTGMDTIAEGCFLHSSISDTEAYNMFDELLRVMASLKEQVVCLLLTNELHCLPGYATLPPASTMVSKLGMTYARGTGMLCKLRCHNTQHSEWTN